MSDTSSGEFDDAIGWFIDRLRLRGTSSYTLRTYRLGISDFARWAHGAGVGLDDIGRQEIAAYIEQFAGDPTGGSTRAARTVNHRLSVLSTFFSELIRRDALGSGVWARRTNPVPQADQGPRHGMQGRDAPPRGRRAELRRRAPRRLPRDVDPAVTEQIATAATSARDRAILLLLVRTGQRIGDWSDEHGRHGVLGMRLVDFDRRGSSIVVLLKGSRDEHRVPVTEDFWPVLDTYLAERGDPPTDAAWVGVRRGAGRPLSYDAFDAMLRSLTARLGLGRVSAHQLRHTLAQQVTRIAGMKVAQELLGHQHYSTTADTYHHADQREVVDALSRAARRSEHRQVEAPATNDYVFAYDATTIAELDALVVPRLVEGPGRG